MFGGREAQGTRRRGAAGWWSSAEAMVGGDGWRRGRGDADGWAMEGAVTAPRGEMMLNAKNQPQSAVLTGGVQYAAG